MEGFLTYILLLMFINFIMILKGGIIMSAQNNDKITKDLDFTKNNKSTEYENTTIQQNPKSSEFASSWKFKNQMILLCFWKL